MIFLSVGSLVAGSEAGRLSFSFLQLFIFYYLNFIYFYLSFQECKSLRFLPFVETG